MLWPHERLLVLFQYGRSWLRDFQSSVETYLSNFVRREGIRLETSSKRRVVCIVTSPGPNAQCSGAKFNFVRRCSSTAIENSLTPNSRAITVKLYIQLLLLLLFFSRHCQQARLRSSQDQDWSQVEPRPRQNSKTITVDSNSILNWDKEQLMSLVVCRF